MYGRATVASLRALIERLEEENCVLWANLRASAPRVAAALAWRAKELREKNDD